MKRDEFHNIIISVIGDAMEKAMEPMPPNLNWRDPAAVEAYFSGWAFKYAEAQTRLHAAKLED